MVIAATGYRTGLEPLVGHLGVLDDHGSPRVTGGEAAPGLRFVGFVPRPALLHALGREAQRAARGIVRARRSPDLQTSGARGRSGMDGRLRVIDPPQSRGSSWTTCSAHPASSPGESVENPVTGERFTFTDTAASTGGELLAFDFALRPAARCRSPTSTRSRPSASRSRRGACASVSAAPVVAEPGDVVEVEPGVGSFANAAEEEARVRVEVRPALAMEEMFAEVVEMAGPAADPPRPAAQRAHLAMLARTTTRRPTRPCSASARSASCSRRSCGSRGPGVPTPPQRCMHPLWGRVSAAARGSLASSRPSIDGSAATPPSRSRSPSCASSSTTARSKLAALIAYYAFFSLFPLLLVLVSVLGFVLEDDPALREESLDSTLAQIR